jgi:predicted GIY-YIG superfamily endonuclease/enterochelin esterase-like enzyme
MVGKDSWIAVYIMASARNGTLYTGVTSLLVERVQQHKLGTFEGFSKKYGCKALVWFESHATMPEAIRREKQIKRWRREWKLARDDGSLWSTDGCSCRRRHADIADGTLGRSALAWRAVELVTETLDYDGGRQVTVCVPADAPEAVVFAGDGQLISGWGETLAAAGAPATLIVGVHRLADETLRLHEYSPAFDPRRFAAHERFFVKDVRAWVRSRFSVELTRERTAVFGVSAGGELALALGLRHPDVYGAVFCASPGGGYRPPGAMPSPLPRVYLVAGTQEPFFRENAARWADALRDAGAHVVMTERVGSHGGAFWRAEFPLMAAWAFGRAGLPLASPGSSR